MSIFDDLPDLGDDDGPRELGEAPLAVLRALVASVHAGEPARVAETAAVLTAIEDRAVMAQRAGDELGDLAVQAVADLRHVLELLEARELRRAARRFAAIGRHRFGIRGPLGPDWRRLPPDTETGDRP